jgi:hypothetical protein
MGRAGRWSKAGSAAMAVVVARGTLDGVMPVRACTLRFRASLRAALSGEKRACLR